MRDNSDPLQDSGSAQPDGESGGSEDRLLRLFVGPNADKFVRIHRRMQEAKSKKRNWSFYGKNWIVLFVPIAWFFYRKMFLVGAAVLLVPPILILVFPALTSVSMLGAAGVLVVLSNRWYVERALRKIKKIETLNLPPDERDARIRQAGGTSKFGASLGGLIYAAAFALLFVPEPVELGPATAAGVTPCTHPDVVASAERAMWGILTVRTGVAKAMRGGVAPTEGAVAFKHISLRDPALVDERADPPRRRCLATLNVDGKDFIVFYNVTGHDHPDQHFKLLLGPNLQSMPD